MICDICHNNEATIHVTEIVNNQVQEVHVCEECAIKKGIMGKKFGLVDFLAELSDFDIPSLEQESLKKAELECPNCGLTFRDFRRTGRLGCSRCYETFKKGLIPLLKRIHGSSEHTVGAAHKKLPEGAFQSTKIQELQQKLNKAIQQEEYEEAAALRDKINELKKKNKKK
jgi:protein arginine kinase activator